MADGTGLDTALAAIRACSRRLSISMVRAGLEGAFLEEALERISSFLRKQEVAAHEDHRLDDLSGDPGRRRASGVTIFLVMFVVPMFQEFFDRLERTGTGLPLITVMLVATSQFLVRYGVFVGGGRRRPWSCCCASGWARPRVARWAIAGN